MKNEVKYINKKAIAILRVSSMKQEDGFSHAVQQKYAQDYCDRDCNNQKLELVQVFTITESAKDSSARKKYSEAINYAVKNKIGNVIFYMQDRETRNLTDLEENEKRVMNGDFIIHFSHDRKCLHKDSPESEYLTRAFSGIMARNYVRILASRISDGMKQKAEQGWWPSNHPPLGYVTKREIDPATGQFKKRGTTIALDPNSNNRAIVLKEFELRAKGYSLEAIRKEIKESGLLTAKQALKYNIATIDGRLKNPFYKGQFFWQGELYKGKHDLFVPMALIIEVEKMSGKKASAIVREESEHTLLMGGWLKCSCGCNIVYDPKTKKILKTGETKTYHYAHCTDGKEVHKTQKGLITTTDKIWRQLGSVIDKISISEEFANDISEALNKLNLKTKKVIHIQQAELSDKCKELETQEDQLTDLLLNQTIDKQAYDRQLVRIRGNRESLLQQLEQLRLSLQDTFMESVKSILELATSAKSLWNTRSAQDRKEFLNSILSNPILDGVTVRYELKKPFAVLVKMSEKEDWCPGPDLNWHARLTEAQDFKSCASTNFATGASRK